MGFWVENLLPPNTTQTLKFIDYNVAMTFILIIIIIIIITGMLSWVEYCVERSQ